MDSYLGAVPGAEDEERGLLLVVLIAFTYLFAFDCEALCVEQLFRFISQVTHEVELLQSCLRNNVGGSSIISALLKTQTGSRVCAVKSSAHSDDLIRCSTRYQSLQVIC